MKKQYCKCILTFLMVGFLTVSIATAATIIFEPAENNISLGLTTSFTIILDSAPEGLSGFNLNVRFTNPDVVGITRVTYPPWASMNNVSYPSSDVIRMSAVDIGATIGPGAGPIELGTITMNGKNAGSTDISITEVNMDADSGGIIRPSSDIAHLNILGSNSGSSSSHSTTSSAGSSSNGGGGYSGYSSSGSGTTSTVTPISPKTIQSSAVTTGVPQNSVTNTVVVGSQVVTSGTPKATNQVPFESPTAANTSSFPWLFVIEIFVVIGIIGGVLVLFFVRKGL